MAKKGKLEHNKKRAKLVAKYAEKREDLRKKSKDMSLSDEERLAARAALNKLPANSAGVRLRNRCNMTGRPRGYLRKFGLARIAFRDMALKGQLPGVTKSSW